MIPAFEDVQAAATRLRGKVVRTPMLRHALLDQITGGRVLVKPECLQRTGSFKLRGASNAALLLDPAARRDVSRHVENLRQKDGVTILLTTHILEEADRCDRLILLHKGSIVAQGSPQELKDRTSTSTLEDAYLALTGSTIRDESVNVGADQMKQFAKMWNNRR